MTKTDAPHAPLTSRRSKERRVPISLRVTPRMADRLKRVAEINGRSLTQQTELLLDHALFREPDELEAPVPVASTIDLWNELMGVMVQVNGLRAALEKGLERNATLMTRFETRLDRRLAEFETKQATDISELATEVAHMQTITAHLLATLRKLDEMARVGGNRGAAEKPRPRLVASNGDKDAG